MTAQAVKPKCANPKYSKLSAICWTKFHCSTAILMQYRETFLHARCVMCLYGHIVFYAIHTTTHQKPAFTD